MALDQRNITSLPLAARRGPPAGILKAADFPELRFSYSFKDPLALPNQAAVAGLEGIVSKWAAEPYVCGKNRNWVRVKSHDWREANKDRGELFGPAGK